MCIWCHKLDDLFDNYRDVTEFMNKHYVIFKINHSKENKNEKFLSRYLKIQGYPHFFVLDSKGKVLYSQDNGALKKTVIIIGTKFCLFLKSGRQNNYC
jgi:thioredoxin-related protein